MSDLFRFEITKLVCRNNYNFISERTLLEYFNEHVNIRARYLLVLKKYLQIDMIHLISVNRYGLTTRYI